jgi:hypothetical protein
MVNATADDRGVQPMPSGRVRHRTIPMIATSEATVTGLEKRSSSCPHGRNGRLFYRQVLLLACLTG